LQRCAGWHLTWKPAPEFIRSADAIVSDGGGMTTRRSEHASAAPRGGFNENALGFAFSPT
jgi:hypothetical protein